MKKQILTFVVIALLLCISPLQARAQVAADTSDEITVALQGQIYEKLRRGSQFLIGLDQKKKQSQEELDMLKNNINELEKRVDESTIEVSELSDQLENLERQIVQNEMKIRATELLAGEYRNQIQTLKSDTASAQQTLDSHMNDLVGALRILYMQNEALQTESAPDVLALLATGDAAQLIQNADYINFVEKVAVGLIKRVAEDQEAFDESQDEISDKQRKLTAIETIVSDEKKTLLAAQESKASLLIETQGKQELYESLLQLSRKDVVNVSADLARLQDNYAFFEEKLRDMKNDTSVPELDLSALQDEIFDTELQGRAPLSWPVSPSLGISAYFHDGAYQKAMGVEHNAVDIRALQETKIHAASDGIVTKAADNGMAYSYIIIAHGDHLVTLYGHVSKMLVSEGEVVHKGQVIGFSGGMPGTRGAGWLTTGPHLHFEVFKDFKHVDPMDYLPLELVPLSSLSEKYLERLTNTKENQ